MKKRTTILPEDTIEYTLRTNLPPVLMEKALKNTHEQDPLRWEQYRLLDCSTVGLSLCYLFNWKSSEEGPLFWEVVAMYFRK